DLPRSQMRNQFPVRRQKIVSRQFLRQHPRDLLKHPRSNLLLRNLRRKKMDLQFLRRIRIPVPHLPNLPALQNRHAQLFPQLPRQRLFQPPVPPHLAPGKFPLQRRRITPPPLPNQQPPVLAFHHCRHYQSHKPTRIADTPPIDSAGKSCCTSNSLLQLQRRLPLRRLSFALIASSFILLTTVPAEAQTPTGSDDAAGNIVRFHHSLDNVKATFGPADPVAHLKPGNILEANSLDCFGNALQKPGDPFSNITIDNPLTGPFFIDGAEPGDTLVIHILDLQVDSNHGVGTFGPGFGAANSTPYTPMLEKAPLPELAWYYPIDADKQLITFQALDS